MIDDNEKVQQSVSPETLAQTVQYLCSIGEKVSGSAEEEKACNYLTSKLREYGYEPKVHVFDSYISYPISAAVTVHGKEDYDLAAVGVAFGLSTPEGGFTQEIVDVGVGSEADYKGKDVTGKIVLLSKLPSPHNAVTAAKYGAKGMMCMSNGKQRHKMIITPVWGTSEFDQTQNIPRVHVTSISKPDGERIRADMKNGVLKATLKTEVFEGWRKVRLPTAELKGQEDLFSLVGAHYCSWFDGSTDNVSGDACVLELARVMKQFDGKLRYGMKFCWWPGHSHGRYSGSTWYADTNWKDLHDNAIVYFNIDSPGVKGATIYVPRHQMAEIADFNEMMTEKVTGWTTMKTSNAQLDIGKRQDKYVSPTRPSRAADQSFWGVGVTSMSVYSMLTPDDPNRDPNVGGSGGAWWWHSEHETFDKMDPNVLAQDTRLYSAILQKLSTATVLPFNLETLVQDYSDALREYEEVAGDLLPIAKLLEQVEALRTAVKKLHETASGLNDPEQTAAVNKLFLRFARALNPIFYQVKSGFEHDPALGSRSLPALAPILKLKDLEKTSDKYKFSVVGLKRRVNQVSHTLEVAQAIVDNYINGKASL